jgi:glycosyltransferase involved in cell wall biosynthesis
MAATERRLDGGRLVTQPTEGTLESVGDKVAVSPGSGTSPDEKGPAPDRASISAIITTFNRERHIGPCIESVLWCDEVLVVDSFSSDRTVEIARSYDKVRLLQRKYYGAASQKNWAMDRAKYDWVLILDDDERCTPELQREIEHVLASRSDHEAFTVRRRAYFLGEAIEHSGWKHDRVVRLLRKGAGRCQNRRAHSDVIPRSPAFSLTHPMEHFMVEDLSEFAQRTQKYAYWSAAQLWKDGRRTGPLEIAVRGPWRFVRTYLLQRGFLDGVHGLVFCAVQAYATFLKWAILWSWQAGRKHGLEPRLPEFDDDDATWEGTEELSRNEARRRRKRRRLR